ncbi:hypothetical protein ABIB62_004593 [Mucilaginibacter sp. UYP25]|uniref:hypothetical protein n=1 Tax=unclassified Mucilaginibacter TaxID=2617802 RepID=UPI003393A082
MKHILSFVLFITLSTRVFAQEPYAGQRKQWLAEAEKYKQSLRKQNGVVGDFGEHITGYVSLTYRF